MADFRLLIVDDDASICSALEQVFARADFEVTTARDGEEALEIFADRHNSTQAGPSAVRPVSPRGRENTRAAEWR